MDTWESLETLYNIRVSLRFTFFSTKVLFSHEYLHKNKKLALSLIRQFHYVIFSAFLHEEIAGEEIADLIGAIAWQ